jgi:hypothetical protein
MAVDQQARGIERRRCVAFNGLAWAARTPPTKVPFTRIPSDPPFRPPPASNTQPQGPRRDPTSVFSLQNLDQAEAANGGGNMT